MNHRDIQLNKFDIDEQMAKALNEEKKARKEKETRRRRKKNRRHLILALIALGLTVVIAVLLVDYFTSDVYRDEDEFGEFARAELSRHDICNIKDGIDDFTYDKPVSVAVRTDSSSSGDVAEFRNQKIEEIISDEKEQISAGENSGETHAILVDSASFDTGNGAYSLYIQCNVYKEKDKDMALYKSDISTYMINMKDMKVADNLQVLNVNYKDKASEFAEEYFRKQYNEKEINQDYETYLTPDNRNFNKVLMTGNDILFLFDQNTVVSADRGIAKVAIPYPVFEDAIRPEVLDRYIDASRPMVAITYDDGPGAKAETRILETLEENGSVATFFYLGNRVENFPDNARKAAQIGCEIGNHSWDHPQLSRLSEDKIAEEVKRTNNVIYKVCGVNTTVLRPPYGDYNKTVIKTVNMPAVMWTLDTRDWDSRDAKKVFKQVKKAKSLDGKIILMHSIYDSTADATELIVPWLKEQGYQTVTVSELIKYKTGTPPKPGVLYKNLD